MYEMLRACVEKHFVDLPLDCAFACARYIFLKVVKFSLARCVIPETENKYKGTFSIVHTDMYYSHKYFYNYIFQHQTNVVSIFNRDLFDFNLI